VVGAIINSAAANPRSQIALGDFRHLGPQPEFPLMLHRIANVIFATRTSFIAQDFPKAVAD